LAFGFWFWFWFCCEAAVVMSEVVQSPAAEMMSEEPELVLLGCVEGNVAKACHSRRGEDEMLRQEKRCTGYGKSRRRACGKRRVVVKGPFSETQPGE
jgi:hypothetical protein